jgi:23S rRNA (uracil1939-C5)-methyltransferase
LRFLKYPDNSKFEVTIEKIVGGGDGLARIEGGKVVFVPFSAPGDTLIVRPASRKRDYVRADIAQIVIPGPGRTKPVCPLYYRCGGCNFQHLTYPTQLMVKQELADEALERACSRVKVEKPKPAVKIVPSRELAYRNRFRVHPVNPEDHNCSFRSYGLKERGSNRVVAVHRCPVAVEEVNRFFASPAVTGTGSVTIFGAQGNLFTEGTGSSEAQVKVAGRRIAFPVSGFFQSNLGALEDLLNEILSWLESSKGETAVDLYAGSGLFGTFLADYYNKVITVEADPESAAYARINTHGMPLFTGTAEEWISEKPGKVEPALVMADPPRSGLSASVREYLGNKPPKTFIYISCNPVTFARDAVHLLEIGYSLKRRILFDFFPQTAHVETAALFCF